MSLKGKEVSEQIWNFFKARGFTDAGIAGLMGNLKKESNLESKNLQNSYEKSLGFTDDSYVASVDNGSYTNFVYDKAGFGLAQWTYWSRKKNLLDYAKSQSKSIGDLEMQLNFLYQELKQYKGMIELLTSTSSVKEASDFVLLNFERPADQSEKRCQERAEAGQAFYDKYAVQKAQPVSAVKFTPRKTAPSTSDKYWIHTSKGGLNECILISGSSCIPNCVGYSWGRFYEIIGKRPALSRANAENWYGYTQDGYKRSKVPTLGAVACWAKGKVGDGSDGAGHVAVVEEIKSNGDIVTSNSGYKSSRFWMQTFTKASGYAMRGYTFQGFILPPNLEVQIPSVPETSSNPKEVSYRVKITADVLNIRSNPGVNYPISGSIKDHGVYTIVAESSGQGASKWGKLKSGAGWISLDYVKRL